MKLILSTRTNSKESFSNNPLTYLSLSKYIKYWNNLNPDVKDNVKSFWKEPQNSEELENNGFAIHGVQFGNIVILIQPSRGYTEDNIKDIHSPTLPPHHGYIAHYMWIKNIFNE